MLLCRHCPELVTKQIWVLFSLYFHIYLQCYMVRILAMVSTYSHVHSLDSGSRGCREVAGADWDLLPPVGNLPLINGDK